MINLTITLATFALVFLAELGDKTQIAVISLSAQHKASKLIFLGSVSALIAVNIISVLIGTSLSLVLPLDIIEKIAGLIFISFGILKIIKKEDTSIMEDRKHSQANAFWRTFSLISIAELGDKTQLATIALAAQYNEPTSVLIGISLSFILITGIGVFIGDKIAKLVPSKLIQRYSGIVFILIGIWIFLGL